MRIMMSFFVLAFISVNAITYDEAFAKEFAALSFAAYCPQTALNNWNVGYVSSLYPEYKNVQVFENVLAGNYGYIAWSTKRNAIVIVFRGSSNIQNWISNISFSKTSFNSQCGCQVHKGFLDAYKSVKSQIEVLLAQYIKSYPKYTQIVITGHSLGGAIATLFAVEQAAAGTAVKLTTYGSPRVGDPAFYDWFIKQSSKIQTAFRVVHESDSVPHLPLYAMGFYHIENEIWYHNGGYIICKAVKGEDKACSYQVNNGNNADHSTYIGLTYPSC